MDFLREHPYYPFLRRTHGSDQKPNIIFVQGDRQYLNADIVRSFFEITDN